MFKWIRGLFGSTPAAWLLPLGDGADPFVELLAAALAERGITLDRTTGQAAVAEGTLGFSNLVRECAQTEPAHWPAQVDGWVTAALTPAADLSSFEACRPMLRMKMFVEPPPDFVEGQSGERFGPFTAAVCVDTPTTITSVPAETLRAWGVDYATLKRIALDNFASQEEVTRSAVDIDGQLSIEECVGAAYSVCGSALALEAHGHGMFLAIPTRHHVLTHAVQGPASLGAIGTLAGFALQLTASAPGALSPSVLWLRPGGEIVTIHVGQKPDGGPMVVMPPELEVLLEG